MKLRKSHYGLKFGGMLQFTMKWITVWNGHTQLMFACPNLSQLRVLSFSALKFCLSVFWFFSQHYICCTPRTYNFADVLDMCRPLEFGVYDNTKIICFLYLLYSSLVDDNMVCTVGRILRHKQHKISFVNILRLFVCIYLGIDLNQFFTDLSNHVFEVSSSTKKLVSSAKSIGTKKLDTFVKSLVYKRKNMGPSMDPWGTPHLITLGSDSCPLCITDCWRFDK